MTLIHATCIAREGRAVLLLGAPGVGKSDLALRLIDRGWQLVADDQTSLSASGGRLRAAPPQTIAGQLEVRGVGIIRMTFVSGCMVLLAADLAAAPERLPEPTSRMFMGIPVPLIALAPFEASAPLKLELAFARAKEALKRPGSP